MRKTLLLCGLAFLLFSCENEAEKRQKIIDETISLAGTADSISALLKKDMRVIQNQIGEMVELEMDVALLGSFVEAYKQKERKFKSWTSDIEMIKSQVLSSSPDASIREEPGELASKARMLRDSLDQLSREFDAIEMQAETLVKEARAQSGQDSLSM